LSAITASLCVAAAYLIGSIPVPYLAGRMRGLDLRAYGSGNVGASNVWQSVSRALVVPVGHTQAAQGRAGVLLARVFGQNAGVQAAAGVAVVIAHNWNPWLGLRGGRGIGPTFGVMLGMSWPVLIVFAAISLVGVAVRRIPETMLVGIITMPLVAIAAGVDEAVVAGFAVLAAVLLCKRVLANDAPRPEYERPGVWLARLVCDRDTPDREAWVHRKPVAPNDIALGLRSTRSPD
jgi:glycerol-3-phosphate acyltransferase PlsY